MGKETEFSVDRICPRASKGFFLLGVLQSIVVTEIVKEQWNDSLCRRLGFFWCTFSSDLH